MTDDDTSAEPEFATMARWTVDAVRGLGDDHALAAACRGSGGPAALAWLADHLELAPGDRLLDVGAGMGGFQTQAFILHPTGLAVPDEPIVGAASVNSLLARWRHQLQGAI